MKSHIVVDVLTETEAETVAVEVFTLMQRGWKRVQANQIFENKYSKKLNEWVDQGLEIHTLVGYFWVKDKVKHKVGLKNYLDYDLYVLVETELFTREEALEYERQKDFEPNDLL